MEIEQKTPCYNVVKYRTNDEFKEKQKLWTKQYYEKNKKRIAEKNRLKYLANGELIKKRNAIYREKNKEALKQKRDILRKTLKMFPKRLVVSARDDFYV